MNKNFYIIGLIGFLSSTGWADENWLCTQESSQAQGNRVIACGVGTANTEESARARAFNSARGEFNRLCGTICHQHAFSVEPGRTTCSQVGNGWKCYRGLYYTVHMDVVRNSKVPAAAIDYQHMDIDAMNRALIAKTIQQMLKE